MRFKCLKLCFLAVLLSAVSVAIGQTKKYSGTVVGEDAAPLAGVSVAIRGKQTATQTSTSGEFSIDATAGDILVFTYTGFGTREVRLGATAVINVSLEAKADQSSLLASTVWSLMMRYSALRRSSP